MEKFQGDDNLSFAGPYVLTRKLGQGSCGKVQLGVHGKTGQEVAVKIIHKGSLTNSQKQLSRTEREVTFMRLMNHPCVTKLVDVLQNSTHLFIILEYMPGGDLYKYLRAHGSGGLPKDTTFRFFHQILSGLEYCHSCCIAHRDIKPENTLLDASGQYLKLTDFGMANLMLEDQLLETSCGSPHYASPEVIQGQKYDGTKSDIWSLGVLLYGMCAGALPFDDNKIPRLLEKVCRGVYSSPSSFDPHLRHLINQMLCPNAEKRATLTQIKAHPWWLKECQRLNLNPRGYHGNATGIPTQLNPQPSPISSDKVTYGSPLGTLDSMYDSSTQSLSLLTLGTDVSVPELKKMISDLQSLAIKLIEQNEHLREALKNSQAANKAESLSAQPSSSSLGDSPDLDSAQFEMLSPEQMQAPISLPVDKECLDFIVMQGWTDEQTLTKILQDKRPSLDKAFYRLLLQAKQASASHNLDHLNKGNNRHHVSPGNPIVRKVVNNKSGQKEMLNSQYTPLQSLLRNSRMKSDTALLGTLDKALQAQSNTDKKKKKGGGIFSKVFGNKDGNKDKDKDKSETEVSAATHATSSNPDSSLPVQRGNPVQAFQTQVNFIKKGNVRNRSAPNLVSRKPSERKSISKAIFNGPASSSATSSAWEAPTPSIPGMTDPSK